MKHLWNICYFTKDGIPSFVQFGECMESLLPAFSCCSQDRSSRLEIHLISHRLKNRSHLSGCQLRFSLFIGTLGNGQDNYAQLCPTRKPAALWLQSDSKLTRSGVMGASVSLLLGLSLSNIKSFLVKGVTGNSSNCTGPFGCNVAHFDLGLSIYHVIAALQADCTEILGRFSHCEESLAD